MLEWLSDTPLLWGGVFVLGLLIGSFLNVVILRVPIRLEHDWRTQAREVLELESEETDPEPPGIAMDRSRCPSCQHNIRAHENIPVISYLLLRGKCSSCSNPISMRYPLVELLTGVLFVLVVMHFGLTIQSAAALVLTAFLIVLTGIDIDYQYLPDNMTLPLMWGGLILSLFYVFTDPVSSIIGAAAGYLSFWVIYHIFRILTGKEGMGFGDFKLLAALGAWMGWQILPMVIVLSSLVGAVVGIALIATKKQGKEQPMPFGPFIAAAGWLSIIWGEQILDGYMRLTGMK